MTISDAFEIDKLYQACGLVGFFLYVASFAAQQFKVIDGHGLLYPGLNVLAASCVLVSLTVDFNLSSALIQVSWIAIGCTGMFLRAQKQRPTRPAHRPAGRPQAVSASIQTAN